MEHRVRLNDEALSEAPVDEESHDLGLTLRPDEVLFPRPEHRRMTFEGFVPGPTSREALERAVRFAEDLPDARPLWLWGGGGVGKTHLLAALAQRIRQRSPRLRVWYGSAGRLRGPQEPPDVLLLDDLHLVTGASEEQALLELLESGVQAAFTADRLPHELRWRQRGLRAQLREAQPVRLDGPDRETRLAILRARGKPGGAFPDEALERLAAVMPADARLLLAAWEETLARADRLEEPVTARMADEVARLYGGAVE